MDEDIVDVARTIRPYLPKLVGTEADAYDREIADLIAKAQAGHDVGDQLHAVLTRSSAVHDWAARVLENDQHLPPDIQPIAERRERGYQPLPGLGEPVMADRYECPYGDYVWYQISVSDPVPDCPTHKCTLRTS
jgi:hypothetical protein